jgi:bacillithiol system protein YtxJ
MKGDNVVMFGFGKKSKEQVKDSTPLQEITRSEEFENLIEVSRSNPVFFLKHSTRCPISKWAYDELIAATKNMAGRASFAFVDLIAYRDLSNFVAKSTGVKHESPQLFYLSQGQVQEVLTHQDVKATAMEVMAGQN